MKGIDRPPDADEDWRGSILDHLRHAEIASAFEERKARAQQQSSPLWRHGDGRYMSGQLQQLYILRRHLRQEDSNGR